MPTCVCIRENWWNGFRSSHKGDWPFCEKREFCSISNCINKCSRPPCNILGSFRLASANLGNKFHIY